MKNKDVECPICVVGRNSRDEGGTDNCFHCDTCGFVECTSFNPTTDTPIQDILDVIKDRLISFRTRSKGME